MTARSKLVAFSKWQYPYTLTPEQEVEKETIGQENSPVGDDPPEGYDIKLSDDFFEKTGEKYRKWVDEGRDYGRFCIS